MPELPEVETVTRGLARTLQDLTIKRVKTFRADLRIPFPKDMNDRLGGRRVMSCSRRAKYSLVHLEGGLTLVLHLGMSGRISLPGPSEIYKREKHDHLVIDFEGGQKLIFNDPRRFGMVFLAETAQINDHKAFAHLGPEPLSGDFTPSYLQAVLSSRTAAIKNAIFDQRLVVGVGNIYACEALFRAGIDPLRKAGSLGRKKIEDLVTAIKSVLQEAIKAGGSSLKDYRQTDGDLGYFQHSFSVYNREGEPCGACDCDIGATGGVKRIVQSGRSTFYCPRKQD